MLRHHFNPRPRKFFSRHARRRFACGNPLRFSNRHLHSLDGLNQSMGRQRRNARRIKTEDKAALDAVCMNLSVNLLGVSGAATPYGVKAAQLLDKSENAEYASAMFFVLNATSLQLLPTSLIAVRVSMHSLSPADIVLPTLFTTLFSTLLGGFLTWLFLRPKKRKAECGFLQMQGAGTR